MFYIFSYGHPVRHSLYLEYLKEQGDSVNSFIRSRNSVIGTDTFIKKYINRATQNGRITELDLTITF